MPTAPLLSIVIPVYNEQEVLDQLFRRLYPAMDALGVSYEILFVDDGSRDRSVAMLREQFERRPHETRCVILQTNFGQHAAILAGIGSLLGSHDFRAFCRRAPGTTVADPIVRQVTDASVRAVAPTGAVDLPAGRLIRIELQASSFCHQMVRSIVGQLADLGAGRSTSADLVGLLRGGTRVGAAQPAPSHGLCLIGVGYDDEAERAAGLPVRPITP